MLSKKISAILLLAFLVVLSASCFINAYVLDIPFREEAPVEAEAPGLVGQSESFLARSLPFSRLLDSIRINLFFHLGTREQDNVFISSRRLIENIVPPDSRTVQQNTEAVIDFAQRQDKAVHMLLIPTASAVLQDETPQFADANIYNQKQFIEERYKDFSGKLICVDVYSTLRDNSDKYIYFNTETLLTMHGGYLIYDVLARRMDNTPYGLDRFNIQYLREDYYGSLCDRVEFKNVTPDVISLYTYNGTPKEFTVYQRGVDQTHEYNTLYPAFLMDLGRPLDVYLGGMSPVVDVYQKQQSSSNNHLLIFGDEQMRFLVPFLACDYQQITLVDLARISPQQISGLDTSKYDNILFAYSVKTFMHSDAPSRMGLY